MHKEILCLLHFCRPGFSDYSYFTMEFNGLTSASHMSLSEAGYGSEEGQLGSEISGAVSGVTTPGASRLQASQLQERSATMQWLHPGALSLWVPACHCRPFLALLPGCPFLSLALPLPVPFSFPVSWRWAGGRACGAPMA